LQGKFEIPEIRDKWAGGPIVKLALDAPQSVAPGGSIPLRVVMASNKVGHDFPTGPLDIIQSWLEVTVTDDAGRTIFTSGKRDEKNFIQPGTFLFKAEPVDQQGIHRPAQPLGDGRRALPPRRSPFGQRIFRACPPRWPMLPRSQSAKA
jgi:hypothetical protein